MREIYGVQLEDIKIARDLTLSSQKQVEEESMKLV